MDARSHVPVPYQIGDPQVFSMDPGVGPHQRQSGLVVKFPTLPPHLLVPPGYDERGPPPPLAALLAALLAAPLAAGEAPRHVSETLPGPAEVPGMLDRFPCCGEETDA